MSYFSSDDPLKPVLLDAGEGRRIVGPTGMPMIVKAGSSETHAAYSLIEYSHAAGAPGPPIHVHHEHEEAFYVVEGELTLLLGEETATIGPNGFAVVPRGVRHRPSNDGQVSVRFLFISSPPMEDFFTEMNRQLTRSGGRLSSAQLRELGDRYDSDFVDLPADTTVDMHNE